MTQSEIRCSQIKDRWSSQLYEQQYRKITQTEEDVKWLIEEVERLNQQINNSKYFIGWDFGKDEGCIFR